MSDVIIYIGDSRSMDALVDESVDLVVCSPPLWDHIIYSHNKGQIGNISDYNDYLKELTSVWIECYRVLKGGRFMTIVAHDFYIRGETELKGIVPLHMDILRSCVEAGFKAYDIKVLNIYPKTSREFLPKDERPDSRREDIAPPRLRYLLVLKKAGNITPEKIKSKILKEYWQPIWDLFSVPKILGSSLIYKGLKRIYDIKLVQKTVTREAVKCTRERLLRKKYEEYPAIDSLKIFEKAIITYTEEGELVLDPFIGSGTAGLAALRLGRKCIGYDINKAAINVIKNRLKGMDLKIVVGD